MAKRYGITSVRVHDLEERRWDVSRREINFKPEEFLEFGGKEPWHVVGYR